VNNEKIANFLVKMVCVFILGILLLFVISSCFSTAKMDSTIYKLNEMVIIDKCNVLFVIISLVIYITIVLCVTKLLKKVDTKKILITGLLFILFISIGWIFFSKVLPRDDMKDIIDATMELKDEDTNKFEKGGYFDLYPFQLGYLLVAEILFNISESLYFAQIINAIIIVAIMFILYKITNMLFKDDIVSKIILILECGCFYLFMYSTMIYGNIIGLMFALLSILFLLKYFENNKIVDAVLMVITIIVSVMIKNNYLIFLIAELIMVLLDIFSTKNIKKIILILGVVGLLFSSNCILKSFYEYRTGMQISKGLPKVLWINMGISENTEARSFGWYDSNYSWKIAYKYDFDYELIKEEGKRQVLERMQYLMENPKYLWKCFIKKTLPLWIEPTYGALWINTPTVYEENDDTTFIKEIKASLYNQGDRLNSIFVWYCKIYQIMIYLMSIVYVLINIKKINYKNSIFFITFLGGFLFHTFWEGKSIYVFQYTLVLLPYTAFSIAKIYDKIKNKLVIKENFKKKDGNNEKSICSNTNVL